MNTGKKVVAIIQARMGSTRLPGKTLMSLAGKPLLWHLFDRAKKATKVDDVVLATSTNPLDDALEKFAKENNISCYRGSELDVLERFIGVGEKIGAQGILRICGDAPLIEPSEIDHLVSEALNQDVEAAYVDVTTPTAISRFEYATLDALKRVREATNDSYAHEHVTVYLRTEPNFAKVIYVKPDPKFAIDNFRSAIDTVDDYKFWQGIYDKYYKAGSIIDLAKVVWDLNQK